MSSQAEEDDFVSLAIQKSKGIIVDLVWIFDKNFIDWVQLFSALRSIRNRRCWIYANCGLWFMLPISFLRFFNKDFNYHILQGKLSHDQIDIVQSLDYDAAVEGKKTLLER